MSIKLDFKDIRKSRTKLTAKVIVDLMKQIEIDDLIQSLFIQTDDAITREMLNGYEKQLILAKMKPEEFIRNLNLFYIDMAKYIKKNKLLKNFLILYYEVFKKQHKNAINGSVIFSLYMNIIPQQLEYLCPSETILCGAETNGKVMTIRDPYPYIDYPPLILEKSKKPVNLENLKKEYKKLGYDINSQQDIEMLFNEYTLIANNTSLLSFLIDENTVDMLSFNRIHLTYPIVMPPYKMDDYISSYLNKRNRFLKNGEIEVSLSAGEIRKIILKEVFLEGNLFLIYKIVNYKGLSYTGAYDIQDDFFVSPYSEYKEYTDLNESLKSLILETYIIYTTDIDRDKTRFYELEIKTSPMVEKDIDTIRRHFKKYNKDNFSLALAEVNSYIRKLPNGASASQEAIDNAKKYGIELKPGETFVKAFEKTVYKKQV